MRRNKEKALEHAGERSRAFGFQLAEGTDVDTNSKSAKNQQLAVASGRRGFIGKAGVALAALATAAAPAHAAHPCDDTKEILDALARMDERACRQIRSVALRFTKDFPRNAGDVALTGGHGGAA